MKETLTILGVLMEILAVLGVTIEIIPIKFSPLKWLGNRFNKGLKEEIDSIKEDIKQLQWEADHREIGTLRNRISSFEGLCRLDTTHNQLKKHQYVTAFKDIDKWNEYHNKYSDLNGELKIAIENIIECYKKAKFDN